MVQDESCILADALAQIRANCSGATPALGSFAVLDGIWDGQALQHAEVELERAAPPPSGDGEFARLSLAGVGHNLTARGRALSALRAYFAEQDLLEIDAPFIVPAPGLDAYVEAVKVNGGYCTTSPEFQLKRLLAAGLPRLYCLGHVARAEEDGPWHEREFCMLEWYRAFAGAEEVQRDTEELLRRVARAVGGRSQMALPDGRRVDLEPPFERMSVREAFRLYADIADAADLAAEDESLYFQIFVDRVEPALARIDRPLFLQEFPASQAALARLSSTDPTVAERFELMIGGIELCNGFVELTDATEQRARFAQELQRRRARGQPTPPTDERFLSALAAGMPPAAGNAVGVDRVIALCLGQARIDQVMAFPRCWL